MDKDQGLNPRLELFSNICVCGECDTSLLGNPQFEWVIDCPNCKQGTLAANFCQNCGAKLPRFEIDHILEYD